MRDGENEMMGGNGKKNNGQHETARGLLLDESNFCSAGKTTKN